MAGLSVRAMGPEDMSEVVAVHLRGFPGSFLTSLGPSFLRLFYFGLASDRDGVAFVASSEGRIVGFVAGTLEQEGFYRRLLHSRKWRFALASGRALLLRPRIAPRLLRALRRPTEARESSASACLMSIAVDPERAGTGIGARLVEAFCKAVKERGRTALCLTTDREGNDRVRAFYEKLGFRVARTFRTPEGRLLDEYAIQLGEP